MVPNRPAAAGISLRIMLVNANYEDGTVGGTQTFTRNLATWLVAAGHTVAVLCQGERDCVEIVNGVDVYRVSPPHVRCATDRQLTYLINQSLAIHNPAIGRKADAAVRCFRPDVCHVQMLRRLTPAVFSVLRTRRVATVQTLHELFSLWNFNAFQREDTPDKIYSHRPRVVDAVKWWHRQLSAGVVRHVCAPSPFALRSYLADGYFVGVPATVLPHSVPFEWGEPQRAAGERAARRQGSEGTSFLFVGRLDYYKGIECLLTAWNNLRDPGAQLHIAGEGVMEPAVRTRAAHDPRLRFHGPVHGQRRRQLFLDADVLVCPSTWMETFGLVVLEAYAAGLPVIVSRVGALPELVDEGRTGLVVEPRSPAALAHAMHQMCEPARRRAMARGGADRAASFAPRDFVRRQVAVYRKAITSANSAAGLTPACGAPLPSPRGGCDGAAERA
ncbi:MAG: glycosyltransferase [Pseudonocardiaceae bacterium]